MTTGAPRRINWEITYRCNLACEFCFVKSAGRLNSRAELDPARARAFADSLAGSGLDFYVTGGEPFARPDALDLLERLRARGLNGGVNTNGTLLDEAKARRLAGLGLNYVIVSLHGPAAVQDRLAGRKGSFARAARALSALAAAAPRGTEVMASCTLHESNFESLPELVRLCENLGARRVLFENLQFLFPAERRAHARAWRADGGAPCAVVTPSRPTRQKTDAAALARGLAAAARAGSGRARCDVRPRLDEAGLELWYGGSPERAGGCRSAQETLIVAPNGDARVCQLYDDVLGNVAETPWRALWDSTESRRFRAAVAGRLYPGCARCCQRFPISRLA